MTDQEWHQAKGALVEAVRNHAVANYNDEGWDIVVEAMSYQQVLDIVWRCRTEAGAIEKVRNYIAPVSAHRAEIIAEAF